MSLPITYATVWPKPQAIIVKIYLRKGKTDDVYYGVLVGSIASPSNFHIMHRDATHPLGEMINRAVLWEQFTPFIDQKLAAIDIFTPLTMVHEITRIFEDPNANLEMLDAKLQDKFQNSLVSFKQ